MKTLEETLREAARSLRTETSKMPDRTWDKPKTKTSSGMLVAVAVAGLVIALVGIPAMLLGGEPPDAATSSQDAPLGGNEPSSGNDPGPISSDADESGTCSVTIPSSGFIPPDPFQQTPSFEGTAWYGSRDLWTYLHLDGSYAPKKSFWWSDNFPGGAEEEQPQIMVTWSRLDSPTDDISSQSEGTNAYTVQDGWFMIAGHDPSEPGCWKVTATYKGATLSYTYEVTTQNGS